MTQEQRKGYMDIAIPAVLNSLVDQVSLEGQSAFEMLDTYFLKMLSQMRYDPGRHICVERMLHSYPWLN